MQSTTDGPTLATQLHTEDVALSDIHNDVEFNCRGDINPGDVIDLARSMKEQGLQNPVTLQLYSPEEQQRFGYKYRLVSGYRRHMAARVLEWPTIPAIIRTDLSTIDARLFNLTENLQRKNLNILQEARALKNLKAEGLTQDEVASKLNQSRGWVQVRFMLLELPDPIQQEAAAGLLSQQQVRDLYTLPTNDMRYDAVKRIKDARSRGEKVPKAQVKKSSILAKKHRERSEIFAMMEHIQEYVGNNFGTRCLAWCAGEIADVDLFHDVQRLAIEAGRNYEIPKEALSTLP